MPPAATRGGTCGLRCRHRRYPRPRFGTHTWILRTDRDSLRGRRGFRRSVVSGRCALFVRRVGRRGESDLSAGRPWAEVRGLFVRPMSERVSRHDAQDRSAELAPAVRTGQMVIDAPEGGRLVRVLEPPAAPLGPTLARLDPEPLIVRVEQHVAPGDPALLA